MNIAPIRKNIIKESVIFLVIIGVLAAGTLYLVMLTDDYAQEKAKATSSAGQLLAEKRTIETNFTAVQSNIAFYEESQRRAKNPGLFIDSQAVRDLFNNYQGRYSFKKLSVEMQPIVSLAPDAKYTRKYFTATKTTAKVVMEALSDEDVYDMVAAMQRELAGFAKITSFTVVKKLELSKDILAEVRKHGTYPVVSAEMSFDWYGLRSTDADSPFNRYIPKKVETPAP